MKKLFFILFISTASAQTPIHINGSGTKLSINGVGTKISITAVTPLINGSIIYDDGLYNRWPSVVRYSDNGELVVAAAQGASHTEVGPLMIHRSSDGGASWTNEQLEISATPVEGEFITVEKISSGRLVIFYQTDELYDDIKTAYSDDRGVTWTAGNTLSFDGDYTTSINNQSLIELASGKLLFPIYSFDDGVSWKIILIESTDGITWSVGVTVEDYTGAGFGEEKIDEVSMIVIPDGTESSDATTKILMFTRTETNSYFVYFRSSDGGNTWASDFSEEDPGDFSKHYLYSFGNTTDARPPALIAASDGNVYFVTGRRYSTTPVMNMQYTYAPMADAFNNDHFDWAAIVEGFTANAEALGNVHDWGYFDLFEAEGAIWGVYYDVSTETHDPMITTRRTWIKMVKLFEL